MVGVRPEKLAMPLRAFFRVVPVMPLGRFSVLEHGPTPEFATSVISPEKSKIKFEKASTARTSIGLARGVSVFVVEGSPDKTKLANVPGVTVTEALLETAEPDIMEPRVTEPASCPVKEAE